MSTDKSFVCVSSNYYWLQSIIIITFWQITLVCYGKWKWCRCESLIVINQISVPTKLCIVIMKCWHFPSIPMIHIWWCWNECIFLNDRYPMNSGRHKWKTKSANYISTYSIQETKSYRKLESHRCVKQINRFVLGNTFMFIIM